VGQEHDIVSAAEDSSREGEANLDVEIDGRVKYGPIIFALVGLLALAAFINYMWRDNTKSSNLPPAQAPASSIAGVKAAPVPPSAPQAPASHVAAPAVAQSSPSKPTASGDSPREIAKLVSPSVVLLVMEDSNGQPLAMGSGFVIKDGIVATNLHVVEGASRGYAKLADRKDKFNISGTVATDATRDIVLLAVEGLKATALTLGDSKRVAVGDAVYAVGNPRGLEGTFSAGIISSIRNVGDDTLLQITAPISPGSSGGPVVNAKGEVVGVSVATFKGGQNLNFAIPSAYLATLMATPTKLVKFAGGAKEAKPKVGSILDGLGGNSTEGVEGSDFLWNEPRFRSFGNGSYSFTLRNKLRETVKNVTCAVIFHNDNGEVVDFDLVTYEVCQYIKSRGIIPPGLGKRVNSVVAESVQELTTENNGKTPRTKLVFRVLYFEFVDSE
jgi:S1-C subfamily serine protease